MSKPTPAALPPEKNLASLLAEGRHVAVLPREERLACATSRELWKPGVPLLAVGLHHQDKDCVCVLMPRWGGGKDRRLGVFRLSEVSVAKVPERERPKPASAEEVAQLHDSRVVAEKFQRHLEEKRPARIIPIRPEVKVPAVA